METPTYYQLAQEYSRLTQESKRVDITEEEKNELVKKIKEVDAQLKEAERSTARIHRPIGKYKSKL